MIRTFGLALLSFACIGLVSSPGNATFFGAKTVAEVLADSRPCIFFWLNGVSQSDATVNGAWFAIPRSAPNADFLISALLSAKLTGKPVNISTDGTMSCGWTTATQLTLPPS